MLLPGADLEGAQEHVSPPNPWRTHTMVSLYIGYTKSKCFVRLFINSLPLAIRSNVSTHSFWRQLKTLFYNLAFRPS